MKPGGIIALALIVLFVGGGCWVGGGSILFKIHKYTLPIEDTVILEIPKDTQVLSVGEQRGNLCMWALFDTDTVGTERRRFRIAGTGHPIEEVAIEYIGTVLMAEGSFVIHVFEILR